MISLPMDIKKVSDYFAYGWLTPEYIVEFQVTRIDEDTINQWSETMMDVMENWPYPHPFLSLHDYSSVKGFMTTPLIRQRSKEATFIRPDMATRTAILLSSTIAANIINIFVNALPKQKNHRRERKVFTDRDQAISWLEEWI